jgi:hypothetical protein
MNHHNDRQQNHSHAAVLRISKVFFYQDDIRANTGDSCTPLKSNCSLTSSRQANSKQSLGTNSPRCITILGDM